MLSLFYLIMLSLFLKGFTWEAGCERRQRRVGKRCKHIVDKMEMEIDIAQHRYQDYSYSFHLKNILHYLMSFFLSLLCFFLAFSYTLIYAHTYANYCRVLQVCLVPLALMGCQVYQGRKERR